MSGSVAPSLVKEPRIVFTGVSGAAMTKMKEVCSVCVFVCVCVYSTCILLFTSSIETKNH